MGKNELNDLSLTTFLAVFEMGLMFANCHRDFGGTRNAVNELQKDFTAFKEEVEKHTNECLSAHHHHIDIAFDHTIYDIFEWKWKTETWDYK